MERKYCSIKNHNDTTLKKYTTPQYTVIEISANESLLLTVSNGSPVGGSNAKVRRRLWADDEEAI